MTVLRGEPYSVECFAVQVAQPKTAVTIHNDQGLSPGGSVLDYTYPDSQGFPVYRVGVATLEEPECYFCVMMSVPFDRNQFIASEKSYTTVHGEQQGMLF